MSVIFQNRAKSDETRQVEAFFRQAGFPDVEAYRHNPASIRLRLHDDRFRGLSTLDRMDLVESCIEKLPDEFQQQLLFVLPLAPGEEADELWQTLNREFEDEPPLPESH